ncbi:hypothetical protein NDU88_006664 [Pleurodeles waltl]|uniref:Uncharacterized protein n=1 Tax=Pleurodeles waltl TaxID=8319 RepID=A0AAV7WD79_PLEWA|nr:hypothetical protein NDU88_006664 [Pleurodeles waltl]
MGPPHTRQSGRGAPPSSSFGRSGGPSRACTTRPSPSLHAHTTRERVPRSSGQLERGTASLRRPFGARAPRSLVAAQEEFPISGDVDSLRAGPALAGVAGGTRLPPLPSGSPQGSSLARSGGQSPTRMALPVPSPQVHLTRESSPPRPARVPAAILVAASVQFSSLRGRRGSEARSFFVCTYRGALRDDRRCRTTLGMAIVSGG